MLSAVVREGHLTRKKYCHDSLMFSFGDWPNPKNSAFVLYMVMICLQAAYRLACGSSQLAWCKGCQIGTVLHSSHKPSNSCNGTAMMIAL